MESFFPRSIATVAVLVLIALLATADGITAKKVVELNDDNFQTFVLNSSQDWLVMFMAPWCGHCKKVKPDFETAAASQTKVRFGMVDSTLNKATARTYKVKSYPTFQFIRDGVARPYHGGRNAEAFIEYAKTMSAAALSKDVVDSAKLAEIKSENDVMFAYFSSGKEADDKLAESIAARWQGELPFVTGKDASDDAEDGGDKASDGKSDGTAPRFVCHSDGSDDETYDGTWTDDGVALAAWVAARRLPIVPRVSPANFDDVMGQGHAVLLSVTGEADSSDFKTSFLSAAHHLRRGGVHAASLDGVKFVNYVKQFGIKASDMPTYFVFDLESEFYWRPGQEQNPLPGKPASLTKEIAMFGMNVRDGHFRGRSLHSWYSPTRYTRRIEKYLNKFDTFGFVAVSIVAALLLGALAFACLSACGDCGGGGDDDDDVPLPASKPMDAATKAKKRADIVKNLADADAAKKAHEMGETADSSDDDDTAATKVTSNKED
jgi:protein disulfide-isomerase-like protein